MGKCIFGPIFLLFLGVASAAENDSFSVASDHGFVMGFVIPGGECEEGNDLGISESGAVFSCKQSVWVKPEGSLDQGAACGFGSTRSGEISVRCNGVVVNNGCPAGYVLGKYEEFSGRGASRRAWLTTCYKR